MIKLSSIEIVNEKIEIHRGKLDNSILTGEDREFILKLSRELDELINLYYKKLDLDMITRKQEVILYDQSRSL